MKYLSNAFSLSMLKSTSIDVDYLTQAEFFRQSAGATSVIGHQGTVDLLAALGHPAALNRVNLELQPDDVLFVVQVIGRLPEGKVLSLAELQAVPVRFVRVGMHVCEPHDEELRRDPSDLGQDRY